MTGRVARIYHSAVVSGFRERDRELRRLGWDVSLVGSRRWNEGGDLVRLDPQGDSFVEASTTIGTHPYVFVYDPRPLVRVLRRRPDIVDIHEEPGALATAEILLLRLILCRRSVVLLYSAQNIFKRYPPPFRWIERWALRTASGAYPCNEATADVLRRKGFEGSLSVLPLGLDLDRFRPRLPRSPERNFVVGYVGRLESHKGVDVALAAVAELPSVEMIVVGAGSQRDALVRRASELGLEGRVEFRGFVGHDALPEVYREFDVLVVPSLETPGWIEQFGRVAVEAMATGVPVVASHTGSLPEVVADAGILVPPGDPRALAEAIRALRDDETRHRTIAAAATARSRRFSWQHVASEHAALYAEVTACR